MKRITILSIIGLVSFTVYGQQQQLAKDLAAINHAYINLNKKISIQTVANYQDKSVQSNYTAYMHSIDHYYMESESTELLVTSSAKVALNKTVKAVMIDSNVSNSIDDIPIQLFDTLVNAYASIRHFVNDGTEKYELVPATSEVDKIVIVFDSRSKLLQSMHLTSTRNGIRTTMKVNYSYQDLNRADIPTIHKYLAFDQDGIAKLKPVYKSYRLINYLNR